MYFKHMIAKVSKEIIEIEKQVHLENGWETLSFELDQIYHYEELVLSVKNATNYLEKIEIDLDDLKKENPNEEEKMYHIMIISDHILEYIDNLGYETL